MKQERDINCAVGESRLVEWSWETECRDSGTSVSSSAWAQSGNGGSFTLSSQTLTGNAVSVRLNPQQEDQTVLVNTATLADGQVLKRYAVVIISQLDA